MFKSNKKLLTVLFLFLFVGSCIPKQNLPVKSQLEVRQLQTKIFETDDYKGVLKAILNVLQDEEYIIESVNEGLGFLKAKKEVDVESSWEKALSSVVDDTRWEKLSIIEASCHVTQFGKRTKVRANFHNRVMSNQGDVMTSNQIRDEAFYRDFFSKVDKSIFLEETDI